jgi:hypothetical protein
MAFEVAHVTVVVQRPIPKRFIPPVVRRTNDTVDDVVDKGFLT